MNTRICSVCHVEKPLTFEFFYHEKSDKFGFGKRCKPCNTKVVAAYYAAHPTKRLALTFAYAIAHRAEARQRAKQWNATHPSEVLARVKAWVKNHPERAKRTRHACTRRRRARLANIAVNNLTSEQWETIKASFDHRCAYCDKKTKRLEQDHITPIIEGGSHTQSNVVPACRSCNAKKHIGPPLKPVQPLLL